MNKQYNRLYITPSFLIDKFLYSIMNWPSEFSQFSLEKNKKLLEVRAEFLQGLQQQTQNNQVAYYDFLLVAKQIGLRFEEAKHLMSLKAYFLQNNNLIEKQKLCSLLMVKKGSSKDKYIVKFALPHHMSPMPPIEEQDQEEESTSAIACKKKKETLVNLKMLEIETTVHQLIGMRAQDEESRKEWLKRQNIKIQDADLRMITAEINKNYNLKDILESIRNNYFQNINESMLGNVTIIEKKSGTQLLQVIEPHLLSMELQSAIIKQKQQPRKKPVLAPIRQMKKRQALKETAKEVLRVKSQTNQNFMSQIHKISKIIKDNKEVKRYDFDTNANRLRRLFVQQIIIPFERKNDQEVLKRYPKSSISLEVSSQRIL